MAYTTINKSSEHFNTKLWTGNGGTQSITGVGFQPDMAWIKSRSSGAWHHLGDAVRGADKRLQVNDSGAESTLSTGITSFDSDGLSFGLSGDVNGNGLSIVGWNWKANGAGSANTDGATNTTVSVNTTAGFSIVKWTGTGGATTLGHGLNAVPKFWIIKNLDQAEDWRIYHHSLGNTKALELNNTGAEGTDISYWNNTSPTSSVMTVGSSNANNGSGRNMIAYCFAEKAGYSKFGSYTGNGNADGSFIYTGFKPAFVLIKITNDTGENWQMYDNKRTGFNVDNNMLRANLTDAEQTDDDIDLLSNGFKLRRSSGAFNSDGANYIYMAFAEAPLVGTNGVTAKAR